MSSKGISEAGDDKKPSLEDVKAHSLYFRIGIMQLTTFFKLQALTVFGSLEKVSGEAFPSLLKASARSLDVRYIS
jgi:hypothetical protein